MNTNYINFMQHICSSGFRAGISFGPLAAESVSAVIVTSQLQPQSSKICGDMTATLPSGVLRPTECHSAGSMATSHQLVNEVK